MYSGQSMTFCQGCGRHLSFTKSYLRWISTGKAVLSKGSGKFEIPSVGPTDDKKDWIGPPDPDSNLRPYKWSVPEKESDVEAQLRRQRIANQEWNQRFWALHNNNFNKRKEEFIETKQAALGVGIDGKPRKLTAEQMSEFYKEFLDNNYQLHKQYNKDWYRRNVAQTFQSFKVLLNRLLPR